MKRIEVLVKGRQEEEMGRELLAGIYGVIQGYGCTDVSVRADTIPDRGGIQIPDFLKQYGNGQGERR